MKCATAVAFAVIATAACSTTKPTQQAATDVLRGTHTVLIEDHYDKEMFAPIQRVLPDVRLVSNPSDADVLITFDAAQPHGAPATYQTVSKIGAIVNNHVEDSPQAAQVRIDTPTSTPPRTVVVRAVNRANGKSIVLFDGFADSVRIAPAFIDAWLDANPSPR